MYTYYIELQILYYTYCLRRRRLRTVIIIISYNTNTVTRVPCTVQCAGVISSNITYIYSYGILYYFRHRGEVLHNFRRADRSLSPDRF